MRAARTSGHHRHIRSEACARRPAPNFRSNGWLDAGTPMRVGPRAPWIASSSHAWRRMVHCWFVTLGHVKDGGTRCARDPGRGTCAVTTKPARVATAAALYGCRRGSEYVLLQPYSEGSRPWFRFRVLIGVDRRQRSVSNSHQGRRRTCGAVHARAPCPGAPSGRLRASFMVPAGSCRLGARAQQVAALVFNALQ